MSAFNRSDIAEMVRRRFNGPEGDELRYIPLVDTALRQLAYDISRSSELRNYLMTDAALVTLTLAADGTTDLTTIITTDPRVLIDAFCYGDVFPPAAYGTMPMRLVDNFGQLQLAGNYDGLILKYCIDGFLLRTKSSDNNVTPLVGDVSFAVPYWPTIAQLPEHMVENLVWGNYWATGEAKSENAA